MKINLLFLDALAIVALATIAHSRELHRRIIGGTQLKPKTDPWLVSLWYMPKNFFTEKTGLHHVCGAAIIAPKFVLTAAQCFDNRVINGLEDVNNWHVAGGIYSQTVNTTTNQWRKIKQVFKSPKWNIEKVLGDIAILELDAPFEMDKPGVQIISFEDKDNCVKPGKQCTVAGWGQIHENPLGLGTVLPNTVDVPIVSTQTCKAAMSPKNTEGQTYSIDDTILCAGGEKDKDACAGDAGSPLVCTCNNRKVIGGIVSYGHGCGREGMYGFYTNVSKFVSWIKKVIGGSKKDQSHICRDHSGMYTYV